MRRLHIVDTTLRDGEQTPSVAFSTQEKIKIAKALDRLGVDVIEVGTPAMGIDEIEAIQKINALSLKASLLTWNRMKKEDVDKSVLTGVKNAHITAPASHLHMKKKLNMTPEEVLSKVDEMVRYGVKKGLNISVGAEDASRADTDFLIKLYKTAVQSGAVRVRFADTVGILNPFSTQDVIHKIKQAITVPIDFHGHNDLGMGTANALGAYKGGADWISCSVNGLGERAGNTPLEEIVTALDLTEGVKHTIRYKQFVMVSKLVEEISGHALGKGKPIVGDTVFSHESGIHVDGLQKSADVYEGVSPELFGRKRKIVLGKHSGAVSVIYTMKQTGRKITKEQAKQIVTEIKKRSYKKKMTQQEIQQLMYQMQ